MVNFGNRRTFVLLATAARWAGARAAHISAVTLVTAVCWLYAWTATSTANPFKFRGASNDYYNLLVHGFVDGHLYMKVAPLEKPFEGAKEAGFGNMPYLLDASFYKGR